MKILQLPTNIAGQQLITTKALRLLGHESNALSSEHKFNYESDITIPYSSNKLIRQFKKIVFFFKSILEYDIFHYHVGGFLFKNIDVKILKLLNKKIFIEFWGSEIRLYDIEKKRNKFFVSDNIINQDDKIKRLKFWSSITDTVIVSDHSMDVFLEPYFKKIHVIGQRIEIDKYIPHYPNANNKIPIVVHAPSSKSTKGTKYVINAIESLKQQGLTFEYIEVFNMSHEEAIEV